MLVLNCDYDSGAAASFANQAPPEEEAAFVRNVVGKIRGLFRRLGPADALTLGVSRVIYALTLRRVIVRRYYLFLQPLAAIPVLPTRRGASIAVRTIERDDAIVGAFPRPVDEVQARFSAGSECIVAEKNGQLAGFMWFATGSYYDPKAVTRFNLQPPRMSAWDFDVFVIPHLRGSFVFYKLWSYAAALLTSRGFTTSTSLVWAHNEESIRSHQRLGARPIASGFQIKAPKVAIHIWGSPPRVQLVRSTSQVPEIDIDTSAAAPRTYTRFARQ